MTAILLDPVIPDDSRRQHLYSGDLIVLSRLRESQSLCDFARELIGEAFGPLDPALAQFELPVTKYAAILEELKPRFIHHPNSKLLIRNLLRAIGCDEQKTYFDVPRLRTSTSHDYLTTGIAYAFHPHRDTWYSAPMCQINLWMPVYAVRPDNVMAFHPQHWSTPLANTSAAYDYQRWTAESRFTAAAHIGRDTREQPKALEPVIAEPDLRIVTPVGGVLMFSAAQLHSSIPNNSGRTRFSIDFRIINVDDAAADAGAGNIDSYCSGTTMPDYLRVADLEHVDAALVQRYMPGHPQRPGLPKATA
jgi:hypothetical protein